MDLPVVPQELIDKAIRRFEMEVHRRTQEATPSPPRVITISRQLGSGGKRVAQFLSERLGWPVWDRQILEVIASQSNLHYQARMFEALDESTRGAIEDAMYALLGGVSKDVYLHLLPRAILIAAQNDAIILGRGAHLVLPNALKARIEASRDTRVRNLVRFEGVSEREARDRIAVSDREREGFVRELQGRLRPGLSYMDVLRATFPAGTLSGAPKIRAIEIIQQLEPFRRNIYSGAVGWIGWWGEGDTAIAIRTAVIHQGQLHVQAGAGIVYDSDPAAEWEETMNKSRALFRAVAQAAEGL